MGNWEKAKSGKAETAMGEKAKIETLSGCGGDWWPRNI